MEAGSDLRLFLCVARVSCPRAGDILYIAGKFSWRLEWNEVALFFLFFIFEKIDGSFFLLFCKLRYYFID